jgi:hypothetical protein
VLLHRPTHLPGAGHPGREGDEVALADAHRLPSLGLSPTHVALQEVAGLALVVGPGEGGGFLRPDRARCVRQARRRSSVGAWSTSIVVASLLTAWPPRPARASVRDRLRCPGSPGSPRSYPRQAEDGHAPVGVRDALSGGAFVGPLGHGAVVHHPHPGEMEAEAAVNRRCWRGGRS